MSQISWQMDVHPASFWNKRRFWFIPILKISLHCQVVWLWQSDGGVLSVSTPRRAGGNHLQLGGSDRGSSGSAFCESYAAEWCNLFGVRCGFWCLDSAVCSPFGCFWRNIWAPFLPQAGKRFGGLVVGFHGGRDSFFSFSMKWASLLLELQPTLGYWSFSSSGFIWATANPLLTDICMVTFSNIYWRLSHNMTNQSY